jgi:hypothetical protein
MTITATVRYVANGYIVNSQGPAFSVPNSLYAGTVPEVVYWLGKIFEPYGVAAALAAPAPAAR